MIRTGVCFLCVISRMALRRVLRQFGQGVAVSFHVKSVAKLSHNIGNGACNGHDGDDFILGRVKFAGGVA